jgi:hypothetical protein
MKHFYKGIPDYYLLIPSGKILCVCDVNGGDPDNIFVGALQFNQY